MTARSIRRAAERKARKEASKAGTGNTVEQTTAGVATQAAAAGSSKPSTAPVISASLNRNHQDDAAAERARYRASESYFAETEALKRRIARKWNTAERREQMDEERRQQPDVRQEPEPESTKPDPLEIATEPTSENARAGMGGPRTPEGRAQSSLNSLKHGLTGSFRIVGNEHQDEFDSVVAAYTEEHQPATPTELSLVEKMAEHQWLSRRAQRLQDYALTEDDLPRLNLYIRYQTTNERAFYKAFSEFKKLKKERLAAENQPDQFVSQKQAELNVEWQKGPAKGRSRSTKCKKACDGDSRDPGPVLLADPEEVRLANARALHKEIDAQIRQNHDIPGDGAFAVPMIEVKELFNRCLQEKAREMNRPNAA